MGKNNLQSPFIEHKHVVRLYKQGKCWVSLGLTFATLAGLSFATGTTANAADATTGNTATAVSEQMPAAQTDPQSSGNASQVKAPATDSSANIETSTSNQQNAVKTPETKSAVDATVAPTDNPATTGLIVTTQDGKGNYSTDPTATSGSTHIDASGNTTSVNQHKYAVQDKFTAGGKNRRINENTTPNQPNMPTVTNGDTYQLTNPADDDYVESGIVVADDAIDFSNDFSLKTTVSASWSPDMIHPKVDSMGQLGGDGMAVSFQPVSKNDALTNGTAGAQLGLVQSEANANDVGTISYNVSANASTASPSGYQQNEWFIYQSTSDTSKAIGDVYDTGKSVPGHNMNSGSISYVFDIKYDAANRKLTTDVKDDTGTVLKSFVTTINESRVGQNYILGVTGSTADSKARYVATINDYNYVPADAKFNITSNRPSVSQSGIVGTPGQVLAFYDGTTAPTNADKTYKVPVIQGYHLANTQYITLTAGGTNTVPLIYAPDKQSINVQFVDQSGQQLGDIVSVSGNSDESVDLRTAFEAQQNLVNTGYTLKEGNNNGLANVPKIFNQYGKVPTYTVVLSKINNVPADLTVIPTDGSGNPILTKANTTVTGLPGTEVNVPSIPGYTPTIPTVTVSTPVPSAENVKNGKADSKKNGTTLPVVYTPNDQTITVNFIDENGHSLGTTSLTGKTDEAVDYRTAFVKEQSIINNYYTPKDGLFNGLAGAPTTFSAHPQVINVQLTKINNVKVTATLVPVDGNGNPIPNTTPTTVHNYPGALIPVPEIPGYTPLTNTVAVPGGRGDNTIKVVYQQNSVTNDTTGEPAVATTTPTPTAEEPQPTEATPAPTTQAQPSEGTATTQPTVQSANGQATGETTTQQPGSAEAPARTGNAQTTTTGTANQTTVTQKAASQQPVQKASAQLPQTNEQSEQATATSFLGLMMLSLLGGLGLRKKRSDNQ